MFDMMNDLVEAIIIVFSISLITTKKNRLYKTNCFFNNVCYNGIYNRYFLCL